MDSYHCLIVELGFQMLLVQIVKVNELFFFTISFNHNFDYFFSLYKVSSSISCYTCNSRNETDINCHDPFNPAMSKYVENCKVPKQNHIGVFPARFCVKVIGKTGKINIFIDIDNYVNYFFQISSRNRRIISDSSLCSRIDGQPMW